MLLPSPGEMGGALCRFCFLMKPWYRRISGANRWRRDGRTDCRAQRSGFKANGKLMQAGGATFALTQTSHQFASISRLPGTLTGNNCSGLWTSGRFKGLEPSAQRQVHRARGSHPRFCSNVLLCMEVQGLVSGAMLGDVRGPELAFSLTITILHASAGSKQVPWGTLGNFHVESQVPSKRYDRHFSGKNKHSSWKRSDRRMHPAKDARCSKSKHPTCCGFPVRTSCS